MESSREYRIWKFINTVTAQSLAIVSTLFLAYLVTKHSTKLLICYKKILYLSIICNLCGSVVGVCVQTSLAINYPIAYLIPEGILGNMSHIASHIGFFMTVFIANLNIAILPVQYIYRYILICHKISLTLLYFFILCILASCLPAVITFGYIIACSPDQNFQTYAQYLNKSEWILSNGKIPGFVACRLTELDLTNLINNILFAAVYAIIIFCSFMVVINLRRLKKTTALKTQKMQTQITLILLIQAFVPLVILVIPLTTGTLAAKIPPDVYTYFNIMMMILTAWGPLTYPVCTILIIGSYRNVVFNYCRILAGKKPKKNEAVTVISKAWTGSHY